MHFFRFGFALLLFINIASCKSDSKTSAKKEIGIPEKSEREEEKEKEKKKDTEVPPPVSFKYQQIINERFHFTFEIPEQWKAIDKSSNGDGFFIETDNSKIDFRIFGTTLSGIQEIDNAGLKCDAVGSINFKDGTKGAKCTKGNTLQFFYEYQKTRITFYLDAPEEWKKQYVQIINHIAESISLKTPV